MPFISGIGVTFECAPIPQDSKLPMSPSHKLYKTTIQKKERLAQFNLYFAVTPTRDMILKHLIECSYFLTVKYTDFVTLYGLDGSTKSTMFLYNYMKNNANILFRSLGRTEVYRIREEFGTSQTLDISLLENKKVEVLECVDSDHYKVRIFNGTKQLTATVVSSAPAELTPLVTILTLLHEALAYYAEGSIGYLKRLKKLDGLLGDELEFYYRFMREEYIKNGIPHPTTYRDKEPIYWN